MVGFQENHAQVSLTIAEADLLHSLSESISRSTSRMPLCADLETVIVPISARGDGERLQRPASRAKAVRSPRVVESRRAR